MQRYEQRPKSRGYCDYWSVAIVQVLHKSAISHLIFSSCTNRTLQNTVAAVRTYLASKHERQRPVAADDLTLAHDRRETLKILDRQRHQSGDARQTDSTRAQLVAPSVHSFRGTLLLAAAERWSGRNLTVAVSCYWFGLDQPLLSVAVLPYRTMLVKHQSIIQN